MVKSFGKRETRPPSWSMAISSGEWGLHCCNSFVSDVLANKFKAGSHVFGLTNGGVGYALTGGYVNDIKSKIEGYAAKIKSGAIVVPEKPEGA